ncbi:hypothetical protein [Pseudoalteromonas sp. OOF1S-7]|uniref:hypothetical protein n=1 Tax=Pseudoalteromonas sp. OOF1S-7 TaxID=2917757 RepID=UPI001EF45865|nr:hypothetical protein [Pseudoalteromonas sp. OOF1S-7]MCG7535278.1 hypothetical protein [Pseudoalteromonas sp. OOF1S-7]
MKKIIAAALLFSPLFANATAYTQVATIKDMTVSHNAARIKLSTMNELTECTSSPTSAKWYHLDLRTDGAQHIYSSLLAAKFSGQKMFLELRGCYSHDANSKYPKVTQVYMCDTMWCK